MGNYFKWQLEQEKVLAKYTSCALFGVGNMRSNYMKSYGEKYTRFLHVIIVHGGVKAHIFNADIRHMLLQFMESHKEVCGIMAGCIRKSLWGKRGYLFFGVVPAGTGMSMNGGAVAGNREGTGRYNDALYGRYGDGIKKLLEPFSQSVSNMEGSKKEE